MSGGPVFVVGAPRSGTTLLASILDASGDLAIGPETHYLSHFWRPARREGTLRSPAHFDAFVRGYLTSPFLAPFGFSHRDVEAMHAEALAGPRTYAAVFAVPLARHAAREGKPLWGEKTPVHVLYTDVLLDWFPDARFVQIVRDPRDVALSLARVEWEAGSLVHHLRLWRESFAAPRRNAGLGPANHLRMRYEDLVADPTAAVREICEFLAIAFSPAMLEYHRGGTRVYDVGAEPWKAKNDQPIDPANVRKWVGEMSDTDRQLASYLLGEEMAELGYEVEPVRSLARVRAYHAAQEVSNACRRGPHYARRAVHAASRTIRHSIKRTSLLV